MKQLVLIALFIGASFYTKAQETPAAGPKDLLTVGGGAGFVTFFGDLSKESNLTPLTNIRAGYYVNLERRFGSVLGISLEGLFGKASFNGTGNTVLGRNFESPITSFSLNFTGHFDNDFMIRKKSPFSPYISVGIGYTIFDPYGDLKDGSNNTYYYWSNGQIRDLDEGDIMAATADTLIRDYDYETKLTDSTTNYDRNTISIPITFGLKWKFSERIQGRLFASYAITQTDFIDNYESNGDNDKYLFTGFSVHFVIRQKDQREKELYKDVDMTALDAMDGDGDGVIDTEDNCQNTPTGVKIDSKGCPVDTDGDGIADYLDKEENTAKNAQVDEHGRTITDELLARREAERDSIAVVHTKVFAEDPSLKTLQKIDTDISKHDHSGDKIPDKYKEADIDNNGIISSGEITSAIDGFFEGTNSFNVATLHDLIDFFFEQ
jgi:hypothetical protein